MGPRPPLTRLDPVSVRLTACSGAYDSHRNESRVSRRSVDVFVFEDDVPAVEAVLAAVDRDVTGRGTGDSGSFGWTRWARPPQSTQTMTAGGTGHDRDDASRVVVELQRAGLVEAEHLHEATHREVLADDQGQLDDLVGAELRAEPLHEVVADAGGVGAEVLRVLERDALGLGEVGERPVGRRRPRAARR